MEPKEKQSEVRLLLPPAADYLGQWLAVLQEHYPGEANTLTPLGVAAYRLALGDLSLTELDRAFTETFKRHAKGFRPSAGEIREYLRGSYGDVPEKISLRLPEPSLTDAEKGEILRDIEAAKAKLATIANMPANEDGKVLEITDEMRERHREKTREALARYGGKGVT
jgi:hypothetical protein